MTGRSSFSLVLFLLLVMAGCGSLEIIEKVPPLPPPPPPPPPVIGHGGVAATGDRTAGEVAAICKGLLDWADRVVSLGRKDLTTAFKVRREIRPEAIEETALSINGLHLSATHRRRGHVVVQKKIVVTFADGTVWRIEAMGRFGEGMPDVRDLQTLKETLTSHGFTLVAPVLKDGLLWVRVQHD